MIDLYNGQITDILPINLKESANIQALSYSIMKGIQRVLLASEKTNIYSNIDNLSENILDMLAVELRTQYYDEAFSIEIKRNLIKNTLKWYLRAGTSSVVNELISAIYGEGKIEEWFEYGGEPYHFKIKVWSEILSYEEKKHFLDILDRIKRKSAVLESIVYVFSYYIENQHDFATRIINRISLSPFNSYPIARYNGQHKYDGTVSYAGYTIIPYQFPVKSNNRIFLFGKHQIQTNNTNNIRINNKHNLTTNTQLLTKVKSKNKIINSTVFKNKLKNENVIEDAILTTIAPIKYNGKYKYDGTAYYDGKTAKYNL